MIRRPPRSTRTYNSFPTRRSSDRCTFNLREVKYDYPAELVPKGETPASHLRKLTETGMRRRWPEGAPAQVVKQIEDELALIAELGYEAFFLTVEDIVR